MPSTGDSAKDAGHRAKHLSALTKREQSALTKREQQVAGLVCRGHSNKIIAQNLRLSEGTVKLHILRILQKLGVRNRAELIALSSHGEL